MTTKCFLQFDRDADQRGEHDHERAVLLALDDLLGQRLNDLRAAQKLVKILQHQQRRAVGTGQRVDAADRGQWIGGCRVGFAVLTGQLQPLSDVPYGQAPLFLTAELGDFGQRILVFVGLDPEACKAGCDVLTQVVGK